MKSIQDEKKGIVLIGMPAVGKSTIGVILAKIMGYHFLDSDICIQEQEGMLLSDIIEQKGIQEFLDIEEKVNQNIPLKGTILATGGSAVYGKKAMEYFQKNAIIIYLQEEFDVLESRLSNIKGRGVVFKEGQSLFELFRERVPLYEGFAHITIFEKSRGPEETILDIQEELNDYLKTK